MVAIGTGSGKSPIRTKKTTRTKGSNVDTYDIMEVVWKTLRTDSRVKKAEWLGDRIKVETDEVVVVVTFED